MSTSTTTAPAAAAGPSNINSSNNNANNKSDHKFYNFWRGHPNHHLLPATEMQEILQHMASPANQDRLRASLQYLSSDRGDPKLLQELGLFLQRQTNEDQLPPYHELTPARTDGNDSSPHRNFDLDRIITHGVSHGLEMLCSAQTTPGDVVLIERPSYFLAAGIFRSHGLAIESLPMKRAGTSESGALVVDVDALEEGLQDGSIRVPRMVYIVPTHQNPTASTMPIGDRWKLCKLARHYGFLVAADEVYHLLDWREDKTERPARFSVLDRILSSQSKEESSKSNDSGGASGSTKTRMGCSVSVNSFTKIFTPGVRCGWIEGPTEIIDSIVRLGYIQSQGACAPFIGNVLQTALEEGFQDRILQRLNDSYRDRSRALCDILESEPGIRVSCRPTGGYFVWVDFLGLTETEMQVSSSSINSTTTTTTNDHRTDSPASLFARYCYQRGLRFMPGTKCDSVLEVFEQSKQPQDLCQDSARLCFAHMDSDDVAEGARLLVRLYREYTNKEY